MELLDNLEKELYSYRPALTRRPDFWEFWEGEKAESANVPLDLEMKRYNYPAEYVDVYDISFNGCDESRVHGWFMVPAFLKKEKYPCLVNYHGFNGDRGVISDFFLWIMAGMAVLTVDCRDQGGQTGSAHAYHTGIVRNVTTRGILDPHEYYYKAVYLDCLRALDIAACLEQTDEENLVVHGISQGGGIGMAVCCLDGRPRAALLDVPSISNLEARVWGENGAFSAVTEYLRKYPDRTERVFETLSYFDIMNMAEHMKAPLFASVALKDDVCPAKHYFAAYNRVPGSKQITVYPFNGHDGARWCHWEKKLAYLKSSGII